MSASITDYFNKASNMNGSYPPVAEVSSARLVGSTTLSCDDLTGWATDTPVHFSTFQVLADGTVDRTTQTDWKGIVVDNTITQMTRLAGAADSGNASGDRVELNPTIGWLDDLITGLLVSHNQDGTLKDGLVQARNIDWSTLGQKMKVGANQIKITGTQRTLPALVSSSASRVYFDLIMPFAFTDVTTPNKTGSSVRLLMRGVGAKSASTSAGYIAESGNSGSSPTTYSIDEIMKVDNSTLRLVIHPGTLYIGGNTASPVQNNSPAVVNLDGTQTIVFSA